MKEYKLTITRECIVCGVEFTAHGVRAKYCPDCKGRVTKEDKRRRARENYLESKTKEKIRQKAEKGKSLNAAIAEAKRLGISYGKYKAIQYIKEHQNL